MATDLRELPEALAKHRPCALHYSLQPPVPQSHFVPLTETDFRELCEVITDQTCYFKVLDATTTPIKVRMFTDEKLEEEVVVDPTKIYKAAETGQLDDVLVHLQKIQDSAAV